MHLRGRTGAQTGFTLLAACILILIAGAPRAAATDGVGTAVAGPTPGKMVGPQPGITYGPTADADGTQQRVTETPGAVAGESYLHLGLITFRTWAFKALDVPVGSRPFDYPKVGSKNTPVDEVSMQWINGVPYDFALRQAESGYHALNSYRLTGEQYFLIKAEAQADHLIARHASVGSGWFYPSGFYYYFGQPFPDVLVPPWYSGIAQGAAVGFFARLYETTGKQVYKNAADHTLESFLVRQGAGHPWVSRVDSSGYLRLEEYPGTGWEFVFNGHMEAAMGLWDYYRVTHDARALALYKGALTSVVKYGELFRTRNWVSAYSLGARRLLSHYHVGVMRQMRQLHTISGDPRFIHLVNDFDDDYPPPVVTGVVRVLPGSHELRRFSDGGACLTSRMIHPRKEQLCHVNRRKRVHGQSGIWLSVTSGSLKGYYVREVKEHVFIRGAVDTLIYDPSVRVKLRAGHWTAKQFNDEGGVTDSQPLDVPRAESARVSRRAVMNGMLKVLLASGPLTGYWVPQRAVVLP